MNKIYFIVFIIIFSVSCKKDTSIIRIINDDIVSDDFKINEIQTIGSHNSYRVNIAPELFDFLKSFNNALPDNFKVESLDYVHLPLQDQFYEYGVRHVELDLYLDPLGGLYYNRKGYEMIGDKSESNIEALQKPGIKIMHIPDIDFETHYLTLNDALRDVKAFSDDNPNHLPITFLLELKKETLDDFLPNLGFMKAIPWQVSDFDVLEQEILAVFAKEEIIVPDNIRKGAVTLRDGVIQNGWPRVGESRGKVMFCFINSEEQNDLYKESALSLENKLIFTNAKPQDDDAAFLKLDNPIKDLVEIQTLVDQGFMIRTRSDSDTREARTGDYSKWDAALISGAQLISTDYYRPDYRSETSSEWTSFSVGFQNGLYQTNQLVP